MLKHYLLSNNKVANFRYYVAIVLSVREYINAFTYLINIHALQQYIEFIWMAHRGRLYELANGKCNTCDPLL